jgi:phosphate transport system substrate-binding protein
MIMKVKNQKGLFIFLAAIIFFTGCKSFEEQKNELPDHENKGTIYVSADESFKPVIDEMVQVYESQHVNAKIIVDYKPEAECLKDLLVDSVRMVIATRWYHDDEKAFIADTFKTALRAMTLARDGIAIIVHPDAEDSLFTMEEIRDILTGRFKKNLIPVFDGVKATSTVRFIIDSVLRGDSLTPRAVAARTSEGVIEHVSRNKDVIGFIGVSWIGNPEDTSQLSFLKKVRVGAIESTDMPDSYVKAYQANIYIKRYPMVRDLNYILKENYKGLGHAFASFMSGEIGQLIFKRAYLAPAQKRFGIRPVRLNE